MRTRNRNLIELSVAAVAGAALMYLFDPLLGARRRAMLRDKAEAGGHDLGDYAQTQAKRVLDHARGLSARARTYAAADEKARSGDYEISERIRARLGHVVSHPRAIGVDVAGGSVCLSGHVLADEYDAVLSAVWAVPGVADIEDGLTVHDEAGNIPALQS